jgi:hypothetical protein
MKPILHALSPVITVNRKLLINTFAALLIMAGTATEASEEGAFIEKDGIIVIEAESGPSVTEWAIETSHGSHTGAGYIRFNANNTSSGPPNGRRVYLLKVTTPGLYKMDARVSRPVIDPSRTDLANDCYTKMVGHAGHQGTDCKTYKPGAAAADTWHWDKFIHYTAGHQHIYPKYNLVAGINRFEVSGRAKEFKIDRIVFYHATEGSKSTAQNLSTLESERVSSSASTVSGDLKQWHKVSVTFDGPDTSETATPNPFLDYRLNVTFTQDDKTYVVPGYYCADGDAANTSATAGNKWRVNFAPPTVGTWSYSASFRTGSGVAVDSSATAGTATSFDGDTGSFVVAATDKTGDDLRGKGLLQLTPDKPYLRFAGTGDTWIKGGTDSPEDLLGCSDFDNTTKDGSFALTSYPDHVTDWVTGDPTWGSDKGKGIIGVFNYFNAQKVNSAYFLPMNLGGDGNNTHPFASTTDDLVYDCSKLAQWGIVLDHAQTKGVALQVVLNEAETANKNRLDNGTLGTERKLFYRELIARFGHNNGVKWMICEEYNHTSGAWSPDLVKSFAAFIRSADPYDHPIGIHNFQGLPIQHHVQDVFDTFFGDSNFDYLSIQYRPGQYSASTTYADVISHLRNDTSTAGRPLALMFDELERATTADDESHVSSGASCASGSKYLRKATLWQSYLGGAGGVEWILSDLLDAHDFRRYEALWGYTRHARIFMEQLPLGEMVPSHNLLTGESTYTVPRHDIEGVVLAKAGEVYAIQLPNATQTGTLNLAGTSGDFTKKWFNPRTGQFEGSTTTITGGGNVSLGTPPSSTTDDWVVLIQKVVVGNQSPNCSISSPSNSSEFTSGETITVHATALDPDGTVTKVEFYAGTTKIGEDTTLPYSLAWGGAAIGSHSLTVVAADNDGAYSTSGIILVTVNAIASGQHVTSFTLINADTDTDIGVLNGGDTLNMSSLPTANLNIRANTSPATVGSVRFGYDTNANQQTETSAPYAFAGDNGAGDYGAWTPTYGSHTVTATPYTAAGGGGTAGTPLVVKFRVINDTDSDDIHDSWEQTHFGNLTSASGSTDYDGDGASDHHESLTKTDPRDRASVFKILSLKRGSSANTWDLEWSGSNEVSYSIYTTSDLIGSWNLAATGLTGSNLRLATLSSSSESLFFRVVQE